MSSHGGMWMTLMSFTSENQLQPHPMRVLLKTGSDGPFLTNKLTLHVKIIVVKTSNLKFYTTIGTNIRSFAWHLMVCLDWRRERRSRVDLAQN